MDHDAIRQAIAAYALDALDGDQRGRVEHDLVEHLPGCAECSAMLRDFREVASDLGVASAPRAASEASEEKLLAAVRAQSAGRRSVRTGRAWVRVSAVAAAAMLAASSTVAATFAVRAVRAENRAAALARAVRIAGAPDARTVPLRGREGSMIVVYRPGGAAVLVGDGIAAPPAGRVLELWLQRNGRSIPIRTFTPRGGVVSLALSIDLEAYTAIAITVERGFVRAPTSAPIYAATLGA